MAALLLTAVHALCAKPIVEDKANQRPFSVNMARSRGCGRKKSDANEASL
jgi:hypothetical protein